MEKLKYHNATPCYFCVLLFIQPSFKKMKKLLFLIFILSSQFIQAQVLLKNFDILSPANNAVIVLGGAANNSISFSWNSSKLDPGAIVSHNFRLDFTAAGVNSANPLYNICGRCTNSFDTVYTVSHLNLINLLSSFQSFNPGDTIVMYWGVWSSAVDNNAAYQDKYANQAFKISFVRGILTNELKPFSLISPANATSLFINGASTQTVLFQWNKTECMSNCGYPRYFLVIDSINGNFDYPLLSRFVGNGLGDTSYSLGFDECLNILDAKGKVPYGTTNSFKWSIRAINNDSIGNVIYGRPSHTITFTKGLLDDNNLPFRLVSPTKDITIILEGDSATANVKFLWTKTFTQASFNTEYRFQMDAANGNFSTPFFNQLSEGNGGDTSISFTYGNIHRGLTNKFGSLWLDTAKTKWRVWARNSGFNFYPVEEFNLNFLKGVFTTPSTITPVYQDATVYPNPSLDGWYTLSTLSPNYSVRVTNLEGRTLIEGDNLTEIDLSQFNKGIYLLFIKSAEGSGIKRLVRL